MSAVIDGGHLLSALLIFNKLHFCAVLVLNSECKPNEVVVVFVLFFTKNVDLEQLFEDAVLNTFLCPSQNHTDDGCSSLGLPNLLLQRSSWLKLSIGVVSHSHICLTRHS